MEELNKTEETINQAYELMNNSTLTEEQVDHIAKHIEDAALDDNDKQAIVNALPSNNGMQEVPVNVLSNDFTFTEK